MTPGEQPAAGRRIFLAAYGLGPVGGMEEHFTQLALALKGEGADVVTIIQHTSEAPAYCARLRAGNVPVVTMVKPKHERLTVASERLRRLLAVAGGGRFGDGRRKPVRDRGRLVTALQRCVADGRPEVMHVHGNRGEAAWMLPLAHSLGIPTVYTEHDNLAARPFRPNAFAQGHLDHADMLTTVSRPAAETLRAGLGSDREIELVKHIVSMPALHVANHDSTKIRALAAGRVVPEKGFDVLLDALAQTPDTLELTIAGDGAERSALEALRQRRGLAARVQLPGAVAHGSIPGMVAAADIGVIPSRADSMPVVMLEFMAAGLPIVATRVGGIPDTLTDGKDAILVAPGDASAMAAALTRLARDPAERQRLGAAARARYDELELDPQSVLRETLALYDRAVAAFAAQRSAVQ